MDEMRTYGGAPEPPLSERTFFWPVVAIGAALILGIVVFLVSMRSRPTPTASTVAPPSPQKVPEKRAPVLVAELPEAVSPPRSSEPDKTDKQAGQRLPGYEDCVRVFSDRLFGDAKQIPATVIDKGVMRNVPYLSYRVNNYEMNVYGDPAAPACVEIGIYKELLRNASAKRKCLDLMREILSADDDKAVLTRLNISKDLQELAGMNFEITPETAEDAYGGWWVSIYDEKKLEQMRASDEDMKVLTVTAKTADSPKAAPASSSWTASEISSARGQDATASLPVYIAGYSATTHVGPRGGVYHYSASGKKVYHKRR
jgi:hypothetical protein